MPESERKVTKEVWYKDGVVFSCQEGCVRCCTGAPGDVFVTRDEIDAIAAYLGTTSEDFEPFHVRHYSSGRMSLEERRNGDCVLLSADGKGCGVYSVRPKQCRDYPFWPETLATPFAWLRESARCPGIGAGETHSEVKIAEMLRSQL